MGKKIVRVNKSINEIPTKNLMGMLRMEENKAYHRDIAMELKFRDFDLDWNEEKNMESFNQMTDLWSGKKVKFKKATNKLSKVDIFHVLNILEGV